MSGVLFRVDVGPGVGLGHVHRNLGLAEALRDLKVDGIFVLSRRIVQSVASPEKDSKLRLYREHHLARRGIVPTSL